MIRVGGDRAAVVGRLWQIAVLTAAGAVGAASQAEAALNYWSDSEPGYSQARPASPHRRQQRARHHQAKKNEAPEKESAKPQGPLIIAISIEKQSLKIYDANGFFAETPISTGMKGHSTPMGVFSIIQKHKLHHSNIYSGAPMPFMQRITWSGVAMHAGVLPGYPASHGCIRMPLAFATKMWNWTKMGARVVVTPGEMTPANFSHPLLVAQKVVPQPPPAVEPQADAPPAAKSDKASDAGATAKPTISEANLELRPTLGHADGAKPAVDQPSVASSRDRTRTADASGEMTAAKASVTMTDAGPSGGNTAAHEDTAAATDNAPSTAADAKPDEASATDAKPEPAKSENAKSEAEPDAAKPAETASVDEKQVETKSQQNASVEIKPAATETADTAAQKPNEAAVSAPASGDASGVAAAAVESAKVEEKAEAIKVEAKADDAKAEPTKLDPPKASEKPDQSVTAATAARPSAVDVKKDQARLPDTEKPATMKPAAVAAPKRTGQIAAFISRKDSKLYVRQNFAPLFDVPVTIAPSDRPLGTHVFTAQVDKDDANLLHWSVVSLPVPARYAERRDEDERASRRRKIAGAVEMKPAPAPLPDSPAEALDRLTIPADAMARIAEALTTGGSIVVSDQGISAGETGEGTDFIVSLR
jgi:lipoprotein-anchoring transpeptidase ErfK/SrfK